MSRTVKVISVLLALALLLGVGAAIHRWRLAVSSGQDSDPLIIFHAGSLALPFKQICKEFK
ncbi:MAG: tungstate ABC transporter substrate-binding protein WtpA, partial [Planctomycetota bacterium]|nr:tungstate ABC transporter substrate-binding protein WtpA [Planctomycetota bacterium]